MKFLHGLAACSGLVFVLLGALALGEAAAAAGAPIAVTTYHYDSLRTGWDSSESTLSAAAFPAKFGVLATTAIDDQVDAQPLLVPGMKIAGGTHDVVYVVSEKNTVYAIDAASGAVLVSRNLGTAVNYPLKCGNNLTYVGITSTPVIDLSLNRIYVIAYIAGATAPSYFVHALDLATLADAVEPVTVAATQTLTDGSRYAFDAKHQRQRPGLLELNGTIYAGFGSFCDYASNHSRGWVLGWSASNLKPLAGSQLMDSQASSATDFFLSSVWMSGYGLASDGKTIFFATGNSDCKWNLYPVQCPPQSTYNGVTNVQESVVNVTADLKGRVSVFTPSDVFQLDRYDGDVGASGVMLLPTQSNGANLVAIVAKLGEFWLLDQAHVATAYDELQLPLKCWCGPSYYKGSDGIGRIVTSAGNLQTWQVALGGSAQAHVVAESTTAMPSPADQDPGFFTTVSSNGTAAGTAIVWAVDRPSSATSGVTLFAFAATPASGKLTQLYAAPAGPWPNVGWNSNIVPLVANGRVYVASYKTLTIFGPNGAPARPPAVDADLEAAADALPAGQGRVTGTLVMAQGTQLTLLTRDGRTVRVDAGAAQQSGAIAVLVEGQAYTATGAGNPSSDSPWSVDSIMRAKPGISAWPSDR
jgi:hypothetical protein